MLYKNNMKKRYRKGIFFIVYRKEGKKVLYLVLNRILHWTGWEFPKAGLEKGEQDGDTLKRELKEETGLKAGRIFKLKKKGKFSYHKEFEDRLGIKGQTWHLFAVEAGKGKVKIDRNEHKDYRWLEFKQAYRILTWKSQKRCLKIVDKFIRRKC